MCGSIFFTEYTTRVLVEIPNSSSRLLALEYDLVTGTSTITSKCPPNTARLTQADCKAANSHGTWHGTKRWNSWPYGCALSRNTNRRYFNTSTYLGTDHSPIGDPVCKKFVLAIGEFGSNECPLDSSKLTVEECMALPSTYLYGTWAQSVKLPSMPSGCYRLGRTGGSRYFGESEQVGTLPHQAKVICKGVKTRTRLIEIIESYKLQNNADSRDKAVFKLLPSDTKRWLLQAMQEILNPDQSDRNPDQSDRIYTISDIAKIFGTTGQCSGKGDAQ